MRQLKRARFVSTAAPIAIARIFQQATLDEIRGRYLRSSSPYSQLRPQLTALLDIWAELASDRSNPLMASVRSIVEEDTRRAAVVLCDARLTSDVRAELDISPKLQGLEVLAQYWLRQEVWYERLILFGNPYWYELSMFAAPRSPMFDLVRFAWVPGRVAQEPLLKLMPHTAQVDPAPEDTGIDDVDDSAEDDRWLTDDRMSELVLLGGQEHRRGKDSHEELVEVVRALPVLVEGGGGVFLEAEDGSSVLVLDLEEEERRRVHRIPVEDVAEGTFVLLRSGGAGDHVVPVADVILGSRRNAVRTMQREWKNRLREIVRQSSLLEVSIRLLDFGAVRAEEGNVRRWMWQRSIRPQDRADFDAILRLVGLESDRDQYWAAMAAIDRAHLRAGQVIRKALLDQVRKADLGALERRGRMEFDLPGEATGAMVACRVLSVAKQHLDVAAANVGKLISMGNL